MLNSSIQSKFESYVVRRGPPVDVPTGISGRTTALSPSALPLYLLVILLPLEVYAVDLRGSLRVTPAFAFMIAMLPVFLTMWMADRLRVPANAVTLLLGAYLAASLVTVPLADDPSTAFVGWGVYGLMCVAYLFGVSYADSDERMERAFTCFIVVGVVVASMGLVQFFGYVLFEERIQAPFALLIQDGTYGYSGGLMRMSGFFVAQNKVGTYLLIPFGLSLYRVGTARRRLTYEVCAVVIGGAIVLSLARNAYVALAILFVVISLKAQKRAGLVAILVLSASIGVATIMMTTGNVRETFVDRLNPVADVDVSSASDSIRLFTEHLAASLSASIHNMGFGRGLQNYDDWAFDSGRVIEWGSHSNFLLFLGETGVIGFGLQIGVVCVFISGARRSLRNSGGRDRLAIHLLAIYCGLVAAGVMRTYYYTEYVWLLMGLMAAYFQRHGGRRQTPPARAIVGQG